MFLRPGRFNHEPAGPPSFPAGLVVGFRQPIAGLLDGPLWRTDEHEVDRWCRLVGDAGGPCGREDLYLPSPGSPFVGDPATPRRGGAGPARWPADRWAQLATLLLAAGHRVTLTGGPAEIDSAPASSVPPPGVGGARVAHLATAYRTPSVLLFGPTSPRQWGPAIDPHLHTVL